MKATTLDLAVGNVLSVKAAVRTTLTGLVAAALLAAAVLLSAASLESDCWRKDVVGYSEVRGQAPKSENSWKECSLEPRARKQHAWLMNGGRIKRDYAKLCAPKWLSAERHPTPSSINGP
jgi:hypothetical protein